jgi:RNA polymerase sigma factor (sigma-70 family)
MKDESFFDEYFENISKKPALSKIQTQDLIEKIGKISKKSPKYEQLKNQIFEGNLLYVAKAVLSFRNAIINYSFGDLMDAINIGNLILLDAIDLYKNNDGTKFHTYLYTSLNRGIRREIYNTGVGFRCSCSYYEHYVKLKYAKEYFFSKKIDPTIEQLAEFTKLAPITIKNTIKFFKKIIYIEDYQDFNIISHYDGGKDIIHNANNKNLQEIIKKLYDELSRRDQLLMNLRFGLYGEYKNKGKTPPKCAEILGITRQAVNQKINRILKYWSKIPLLKTL